MLAALQALNSRIAFVCSLLTGRALEWVTAIWEDNHAAFPSFASFTQNFKEVFEHPAGGKEVGEQLLSLHQGGGSAAEYALSFRTLAAQTGWRDAEPLKLLFHKGLNHELQSELACRDEGKTLEQFINLAIRLDNLLHSRRLKPRSSFSSAAMATAPPATEPGASEPLPILWSSGTYEGILSHSPTSQQCRGELKFQPIHLLKNTSQAKG